MIQRTLFVHNIALYISPSSYAMLPTGIVFRVLAIFLLLTAEISGFTRRCNVMGRTAMTADWDACIIGMTIRNKRKRPLLSILVLNALPNAKTLPIPPPPPSQDTTLATTPTSDAIQTSISPVSILASFLGLAAVGLILMRSRGGNEGNEPTDSTTDIPEAAVATRISKDTNDLAVPYDSAALLAYEEWRTKYKKGAFDTTKFEMFKKNYCTITVANVIAKKKQVAVVYTLDETADKFATTKPSTTFIATNTVPFELKEPTVAKSTSVDVSVPYDSAALLAYDEWREKYNKGSFEASKFNMFKQNYYTVTIANVVAKKNKSAAVFSLDENADKFATINPPKASTTTVTT
jgi:hypothetical protein